MKSVKHKKDLSYELSLNHHLTVDESCKAVNSILNSISETILKKNTIKVINFGRFISKINKEKKGRNPQTGDVMILPERWAYFFKKSKNWDKKD